MILVVIMLTLLDGHPIWIESQHIQSVRVPDGHCAHGSGAIIRFDAGGGILCVKETPVEIRDKIKGEGK